MHKKSKGNKLPKKAKRVFRGVIYEVYHWKQKMFDGSYGPYEKLKRPDTTGIIAIVGDKILIQEQEQPHKGKFLSIPGGRCEKRETTREAAKRELLEETGYVSDDISLWKRLAPMSTIIWNDDYYIARNCRKISGEKPDNGEIIKNRLVTFEKFIMLSENERFRHKDLAKEILIMRLHPKKLKTFKKLLFNR